MTMRELVRAAREVEISEDVIFDAQDADDPRVAMIQALSEARRNVVQSASSSLVAELKGMRMRDLVARARERGIGHDELLGAEESDEPKAAIVELLVQYESS